MLRWLLDSTRITQLAADNQLSRSTGYTYLHEGITVLAAQARPSGADRSPNRTAPRRSGPIRSA